jgi:hypothetical protein
MKEISQMYEFAGAGPCPFPGQLQYRVVNPRGAGVYFDKTFTTPISSTLRVGQVVCGTPRTDPSGMSSYVVELNNGFANALDFEQLTSAAPSPVLASGYYAGAGACPYPGQLQYRVVNPRGASVFFEKSFQTPAGPALRAGSIVCGTPRTDPSGMSSYVVELGNGFASALDFEQLTSAAPSPVLTSGALYQLDYVGAGACPYPGQLQYRVVNPRGASVFMEKNFQTPAGPALRTGSVVCGTPRTDPSGMSSYVVELGNGFASALDFEQLTSAAPSPVLASGDYVGDAGGSCPPGSVSVLHGGQWVCVPTSTGLPPFTGYEYVGDGPIITPVLPCPPGQFWDQNANHCMPNIPAPPPESPFPKTLDDWRRQHVTGWDTQEAIRRAAWGHEHGEHGWGHEGHDWGHEGHGWGREGEEHHEPWREHHREWERRHLVGVAAASGDPAATAAVHAENAAVQAKSAHAAATHPSADGTSAHQSAQAAATHAAHAASHAQAAAAHPSPEGKAAHSDLATAHAHEAASHAAAAHAAIGNHAGDHGAGAASGAIVDHPAAQAASHAQNAAAQAHSARQAAQHPGSRGTGAGRSASIAQAHAAQAQSHARAAASHRSPAQAAIHAQRATMHAHEAASHAVDAHREVRRSGERGERGREGRGREGYGRGREGYGRGREGYGRGGGYRDAYGRFHGRRFHGEWRGFGHPGWRHGIGERWLHHHADCFQRGDWACLQEQITDPTGNICYRVTPAGEMEGVQLAPEQQQANVVYVQSTGQQPPTNDDGPMPGSDPASDGAKAPADDADAGGGKGGADQAAADQGGADQGAADQGGADQGGADQDGDQGDDAATTIDMNGGSGNGGDDGTDQTAGFFAGWDMPFTDPYGYFNMGTAPAWNSAYSYLPPDYWYPGMGWW